jgi:glycosyltransferase involved in cell wall biosynthesis
VPLLTIAVPTFNRAHYLAANLAQLKNEMLGVKSGTVEILVCDNCSSDDTPGVIAAARSSGLAFSYFRHDSNIGSDANIAYCFNRASGDHVLILGDDDLLVDGVLVKICRLLERLEVGVLSFRAYGYERDFREEQPSPSEIEELITSDRDIFILKLGVYATLISANVIAKHLIPNIDARQFCGTKLVQTHLVYAAALAGKQNAYINDYWVACKRGNSGDYSFSKVFVENYMEILEDLTKRGISPKAVEKLRTKTILGFYSFSAWRLRKHNHPDVIEAWSRFRARFSGSVPFWIIVAPILKLPRPLALAWGAVATVLGRLLTGDRHRGVHYAKHWLKRRFRNAAA